MQTAFTLRLFTPSDLDRVIQINRMCLPENYTPLFFMNLHERFPRTFIVAEENNEVIGYVMCRIETSLPGFKRLGFTKKGHIISIAVSSPHQRQGVGYTLVRSAMKALLQSEVQECYLEVRTSNEPAVKLYLKMGFEIQRTIKQYYADGEAAYSMIRKLPFSD